MPKDTTKPRALKSGDRTRAPKTRSTRLLRDAKPKSSRSPELGEQRHIHNDPLTIDYRIDPHRYRILRGEMNVFKTNPYSAELKVLWRFKDELAAKESAEQLWERFEGFRSERDFVGMDVTRKFLQMGRTRSLRYALRPGGRKYDKDTGEQMHRTGEVHDQAKLEGSKIFEDWLKKVEADEVYKRERQRWKDEVESKAGSPSAGSGRRLKPKAEHCPKASVKDEVE